MLLSLTVPAQAADTLRATLVSVTVTSWTPGDGRGVEVTLELDDGREVRFTHPLAASLRSGVMVDLTFSPSAGLDQAIPVACRLETPGTVLDALRGPDCPPAESL
jgi:hypothetical protein